MSASEKSTGVNRRRSLRTKPKKKIRASAGFSHIVRQTLGSWLLVRYRIRAENRELVKRLRPPYLLLANHACVWDPFFLGTLVPKPIHYVVSDATFRSRYVDFGLSLLGGIPKTKAMSDMDSLKNIMRVKDHGGTIGIFPEGQNTWDGHSLPFLNSTAKLAKLLRIPVVTARIAGSYFSKPRWSKRRRRGRVVVHFDLAFTPEQLKTTSAEAIDRRIVDLLTHNEFEFNRKAQVKFLGTDRAEYLERALFVCPSCRRIATLQSKGSALECTSCGYMVHYTLHGNFRSGSGELRFDNIHEWNLWQVEEFKRQLIEYVAKNPDTPFLREEGVLVQIGYKSMPLAPFHNGAIELYADHIGLGPEPDGSARFPILGIRGANVQNNEHWEFYSGADLYRVTIGHPRGCTYKWDLAVRLIGEAGDKNRSVE